MKPEVKTLKTVIVQICLDCISCIVYVLFAFPADTVDSITPDKVRGLRDMLNSSAMDIMYYTSPLYRDEVSLRLLDSTLQLSSLRFIHKHQL